MGNGSSNQPEADEDYDSSVIGLSHEVADRLYGRQKNNDSEQSQDGSSLIPGLLSKSEQAQKVNQHYRHQIKLLRQHEQKLKEVNNAELIESILRTEAKLPKGTETPKVCKSIETVVAECYLKHQNDKIQCAAEVAKLVTCVKEHYKK